MGRVLRIRSRVRRFNREHRWSAWAIRAALIFAAAFGVAYGGMSVGPTSLYNLETFALGVSLVFAAACLTIAILTMRLRWLGQRMRKIALKNESLSDRNWELKVAEEHARSLFESQSDLIVLRDSDGIITSVNEAY